MLLRGSDCFSGYLNDPELTAQVFDEIATFRVPRYVGFVTEWPMSGTKIKKVIPREMIAADLKGKGHYPRPKITIAPLEGYIH